MTWLTGPRFPCGGALFMPSLTPCGWAKAASRRMLSICSAVRRMLAFVPWARRCKLPVHQLPGNL
jgi:hypothetical protein